MSPPHLLLLVAEDWHFCSHRFDLAKAALAAGYKVTVVTKVQQHGEVIRNAGLGLVHYDHVRGGTNPLVELRTVMRLIAIYRRERPDIVHHVAMKQVLYGSIAARFARSPRVVNAVAGLGWLFISTSVLAKLLHPFVRRGLRWALSWGIALVQNPDDAQVLRELGVSPGNIRTIAGSGVNLAQFDTTADPPGVPAVVLPARLVLDKGVREFAEAARLLKQKGIAARFLLAGEPDPFNPTAVSRAEIERWVSEERIEYFGWVTDMPALLARCHIVCLPSYREGLPRALLEAAAAGRPIVATDVPGCRGVVSDGVNGFLVPARDAHALADSLERLITDARLRRQMGARSRCRAEREFALDQVLSRTLALYTEIP